MGAKAPQHHVKAFEASLYELYKEAMLTKHLGGD